MRHALPRIGWVLLATAAGFGAAARVARADPPASDLAAQLRTIDPAVVPPGTDAAKSAARIVPDDLRARFRAAAVRENEAWAKVQTRADWEAFRDARIAALRDSLGPVPAAPRDPNELKVLVAGKLAGDGYRIENLVYETRPGLVATANLYLPADKPKSMPGVLLSHSHHAPKTQGELQDMGVTWARLGCAVLVPDHVGHGERRQHPFVRAEDYAGSFKVGRQDYYFRYAEALQLHLAGDSLMGWMAWDLMRGVDVLLGHAGADKERIVLIGAVAGGGDPAGVAAALDGRIKVVVPFNFGGPQPDYSIPADAERDFYWFGAPWWESTRCLRLSARDGFAHWVIVGSVAPRCLGYGHEFSWDRDRDPAWPRLRKVFDWYGVPERLAAATGRGSLKGQPPESSHANNVGPVHRAQVYPLLKAWLGMEPPAKESSDRHPADALACLTPEAVKAMNPRPLHEVAAAAADARAEAMRKRLATLPPADRRKELRSAWAALLGDVEPAGDPKVTARAANQAAGVTVERLSLEVEPGIVVPTLLLVPKDGPDRPPVVVMVAQDGKGHILRDRPAAVADLLAGGVAVCLPDVRGTGETGRKGDDRGRTGEAADWAQSEFMLGRTLLGDRVRDLRSVLRFVRGRADLDGDRVTLWGESFAATNPPDRNLVVPADADPQPAYAEPLGQLLVLFGMLFDEDVRAGYARGGLTSFRSCLQGPFCYVPADVIVPGALTAGDLADVAAAVAPRSLRQDGPVDGMNRLAAKDKAEQAEAPTQWVQAQLGR